MIFSTTTSFTTGTSWYTVTNLQTRFMFNKFYIHDIIYKFYIHGILARYICTAFLHVESYGKFLHVECCKNANMWDPPQPHKEGIPWPFCLTLCNTRMRKLNSINENEDYLSTGTSTIRSSKTIFSTSTGTWRAGTDVIHKQTSKLNIINNQEPSFRSNFAHLHCLICLSLYVCMYF